MVAKTIETRILQFSACTLIFTEYTVWANFGGMSRSALEVCFFVISQSECANEVLKYANEVFNMQLYNNKST